MKILCRLEANSLDFSQNNVLLNIETESIISQIEQDEQDRPIARKFLKDRTIYNSRPMAVYQFSVNLVRLDLVPRRTEVTLCLEFTAARR